MKVGRELPDLFKEVQERSEAKKAGDFVVDARSLSFDNEVKLVVPGHGRFAPNRHMMNQLRSDLNETFKFDLRAGYWDACAAITRGNGGNLLAEQLNEWLSRSDKRKLVRCYDYKYAEIPNRENVARAWLSDKYYRMDYEDLLHSVLPLMLPMYQQGRLQFDSCDVTDTSLYMKFHIPELRREIRRPQRGDGHITNMNEVVDFGGIIKTSEVGASECIAAPYTVIQWCNNGATHMKYGTRRRHVGKRISAAEEKDYSERSIRLDDMAFWSKFRDDTEALLTGVYAGQIIEDIERSMGIEIPHAGNAVEVLKQRWSLTNEQGDSILAHFLSGKHFGMDLWGLSNAVTSAANEQEDYDFASELEVKGAELLNWSKTDLRELVKER